ncbi:MAG: hypothetical protein JW993_01125 [Sedimentisphaerales bacterium]|nr:hypothetical protein [Sedimentisphaerales bacterium]
MDPTTLIPDNVSEVLAKIVQFTESRQSVLYRNLCEMRADGFAPQDLPVYEFATALEAALAEHLRNQRLLFRDTENIKFGPSGMMTLTAVPDAEARALLALDINEYLVHAVKKLKENALNRRVAENLLSLKRGSLRDSDLFHSRRVHARSEPRDDTSTSGNSAE